MSEKESQSPKESVLDKKTPCQVAVTVEGQTVYGNSLHFNERGMLVNCQQPVALNKKVKLVLQFPGFRNAIEIQGEVVWSNSRGHADTLTPRGMGVKYLNVEREVERLLAEIAGQYETFGSIYSCYYT